LQEIASRNARYGLEGLTATYLDRLAALRADPPGPGWDGVFRASAK